MCPAERATYRSPAALVTSRLTAADPWGTTPGVKRYALIAALIVSPLASSLAACRTEAPPATPSAATSTPDVVVVPAPAPAPKAAPSGDLPPGHPAMGGAGTVTDKPADPANMPNDSVHAGLRAPPDPNAPPAPGAPAGQNMISGPAETGVPLPLPLEGPGSVAELKGRLGKIADTTKHALLEEAFRKIFTVDRPSRNGLRAKEILEPMANDADKMLASFALRMLGYVALNSGFDTATARDRYEKALALDETYGETHYALAFVLAISDKAAGKAHFDRALALGVPDVRGLKEQFYSAPPAP